jgi:hypothetical protein
MKVKTLLYAEVDESDSRFCGHGCKELFPTTPCQCLRFGEKKCVELEMDADTNKPLRCKQCVKAERRFRLAVKKARKKVRR